MSVRLLLGPCRVRLSHCLFIFYSHMWLTQQLVSFQCLDSNSLKQSWSRVKWISTSPTLMVRIISDSTDDWMLESLCSLFLPQRTIIIKGNCAQCKRSPYPFVPTVPIVWGDFCEQYKDPPMHKLVFLIAKQRVIHVKMIWIPQLRITSI